MAATPLNIIPGDPGQNAYVSVAVADQYHADRPNPADVGLTWISASPDAKIQAILWATKLLDAIYEWTGFVANIKQPLLWPRWGMFRPNGWDLVLTTEIPIELQRATAEFARNLLVADRVGDSDIETQRITSVKAGSVAVTFGSGVTTKPVPDSVFYLIPRDWGYPRGRVSSTLTVVRS